MGTKQPAEQKRRSEQTSTFLLELPLVVSIGQAKSIRGHLEAGRQFYNAVLSQELQSLRHMRTDPAWQVARAIPRTHMQERRAAKERKPVSHRKSLYGRKVHEIVAIGNIVILEKLSYKAWKKQYGRSVGL